LPPAPLSRPVRGHFALLSQPRLRTGPSRRSSANLSSDACAPTPAVPLSAFAWFFPSVIGLPLNGGTGSASAIVPRTRLFAEQHFVAAASPLCSGLRVCLPPGSLLPLQVPLQGSWCASVLAW